VKGMSLRKSINAKCKDCTYDRKSHGGTWRQQVEACAVTLCPLHPVRPKTTRRVNVSAWQKEESQTLVKTTEISHEH
jgi:hypothetical protein